MSETPKEPRVLADHHQAWLESRGIDPELAAATGLYSADPIGTKGRDKGKAIRPGEWIAFPFMLNGVEAAVQHRNVVEKTFLTGGADAKQLPLWHLEAVLDQSIENEPVVITEGMSDCLTALQADFPRSASVPNGSGSDVERCFNREVMRALRGATVVLAFDGDVAGNSLAQRVADRLGAPRCRFAKYPPGCKDLNDVHQQHGIEAAKAVIAEAPWFPVEGVNRLSQLPQAVEAIPMRLGFGDFDNHFRPRLGDFYVITGIPSHGKSVFARQVIASLARRFKLRTAIASFEEEPTTDLRHDLQTQWSGRPYTMLNDDERKQANDWIDENFRFLVAPEDVDPDVDWVLQAAGAAVLREGCRVLVIDPFNQLDHYHPGETATEYIGHALKRIARFARQTKSMVWVVAHPAKLRRLDNGKYPNVNLWDVADSAHFYNRPDGGIIVRRDKLSGKTEIEVAKARHRKIGFPGVIQARFDQDSQRLVFSGELDYDLDQERA